MAAPPAGNRRSVGKAPQGDRAGRREGCGLTDLNKIWEVDLLPLDPFWHGRKVAVTGAGGFLGARLTGKLIRQGADVRVATRSNKSGERLARMGASVHVGDLRDPTAAIALVAGTDIVFSLAHDIRGSREDNRRVAHNVVNSCATEKVRLMVHASSIAVYDEWPGGIIDENSSADGHGSDYKSVKREMELEIHKYANSGDFDAVILQPTIVYGPHSSLWTDGLVERLRLGAIALPDMGQGVCNGVYVDDVVDAFVGSAAKARRGRQTYIVSGPQPFSWGELIQGYADAAGGRVIWDTQPVAQIEDAPGTGIRRLIGDPMAIATLPPFRPLLGFVRARLGQDRLDAVRAGMLSVIGKVHDFTYRPAAQDSGLFTSKGTCSIARLSAEIGPPQIEPAEGLRMTQAYIRWRYPR